MELIGNALNGRYLRNLVSTADSPDLEHIFLAVAYVQQLDYVFELADRRKVPISLFALADGDFPSLPVLKRFIESSRASWQLFLTEAHYHPKIMWFRGIGAYIGSANLTDGGWMRNLECGVWLDQDELLAEGFDTALRSMFSVIEKRSTQARREHLEAFSKFLEKRRALEKAEADLRAELRRALKIAGGAAPIAPVSKKDGGAARQQFIEQWGNGLTILRKLAQRIRDYPQPPWAAADVHPAILQDQATEAWYDREVRKTGESNKRILELHTINARDPDGAVDRVFSEWKNWEETPDRRRWVNESPALMRQRLSRAAIAALDANGLADILLDTHASREHARQIRFERLGLAKGDSRTREERCRLLAAVLCDRTTGSGKSVRDLLDFVIWGDSVTPNCAERIWDGAHSPEWKMPGLGENTLGELIGYARPDDYPPRNGRVGKSLFALGYEGIDY